MRRANSGWVLAVVASLILCCGCGTTSTEYWVAEESETTQPLARPEYVEIRQAGNLELTVTQQTRTTRQLVERLYIERKQRYSDVEWDTVGWVTFSILGSIIVLALYVLLFALADGVTDED